MGRFDRGRGYRGTKSNRRKSNVSFSGMTMTYYQQWFETTVAASTTDSPLHQVQIKVKDWKEGELKRRPLWTELQHISNANFPWLLMGEFNAYLSCFEKQGGNRPSAATMNEFRECVSTALLMEVPCNGFHHTWWNKQVGRFKIVGKLDRMFCNALWSSNFPGWNYKVCNRRGGTVELGSSYPRTLDFSSNPKIEEAKRGSEAMEQRSLWKHQN
ncbi:hypothetical protein IFM89_005633 [Coptis chinensis]|uniref:Uncharacterized protein n=1 Tax=Coptis chinensis TaxID=261450 RepID=A0A835HTU5_9MAGN|nr:hypothetical protein IFM89_005633 [Coptis chinensis]